MGKTLVLVLLGLISMKSFAYEKGDIVVKAGVLKVDPRGVTSDNITIATPPLPNSNVSSASSDTLVGLGVSYMLTDNIAFEVLASPPIDAEINVTGGIPLVTGSNSIANAEYLPGVFLFKYYPMSGGAKFQPYIAAGLNYTVFLNEEASDAVSSSPTGASTVDMDNNFGYAAKVGFDYLLNDAWLLSASYLYVKLETEATISTANIGDINVDNVNVHFDAFFVSVGMKF